MKPSVRSSLCRTIYSPHPPLDIRLSSSPPERPDDSAENRHDEEGDHDEDHQGVKLVIVQVYGQRAMGGVERQVTVNLT